MKILNMKPWNYVGYAAFPNIDNKVLEQMGFSKEQEHINILTKDDIDDPEGKVWNEILRNTSSRSPADVKTYKRLLAMLVGSYYVTTQDKLNVMPRVTYEDLLRTNDNLVKGHELARKIEDGITAPQFSDLKEDPLGSVTNILFWNDPQKQVDTQVVNMQHTLLMGDYGTGMCRIVMSYS